MAVTVLPSHLQAEGPRPYADGGAFSQVTLRTGEVVEVTYPDDPKSLSGRFVEYRVRVQHRANGTAGVIEYPHCLLVNPLAGLADSMRWRLRADPQAGVDGRPGLGSKVTILCLNGERTNPLIVGGVRDERDDDHDLSADEPLGADLTYNGLRMEVGDDGGLTVTYGGPTLPDGTLDEDKATADQTGTALTLEADGSLQAAGPHAKDKDGNDTEAADPHQQLVRIDHAEKTVTILADEGWTVTVQGTAAISSGGGMTIEEREESIEVTAGKGDVEFDVPQGQIRHGAGADEPHVLGNVLKGLWGDLMDAIGQLTVGTGVGPSSPPINSAAFQQLKSRFDDALSELAFVKKRG